MPRYVVLAAPRPATRAMDDAFSSHERCGITPSGRRAVTNIGDALRERQHNFSAHFAVSVICRVRPPISAIVCLLLASSLFAQPKTPEPNYGEANGTFPSWQER